MPIDKALNQAPVMDIVIGEGIPEPDIEVVIDEDGGATVEIGEADAEEVGFYDNLAAVIEPDVLARISIEVAAMFEADKGSRSDWENQFAKGLDLLGLKMEERTKPFRGATGVAHPMLMEAIIQFQAQAFKELMPAGGPVRSQIMGKETVEKFQQAGRVQDFMNYQITTVMEEYTPEFDQLLFYTGYGGSTFKNPKGDFAGRLLEAAGMKGATSGHASISTVHANFILNDGEAIAQDYYRLIRLAQKTVKEQFDVDLNLEIELLGEFEDD